MTTEPVHSPLGASGTHRWMHCPGSVGLSHGLEDEESDFAIEGSAAHALGEVCLKHGRDAWRSIGATLLSGVEVTAEMANAVQVYLDAVRLAHPDRNQGNTWVERPFRCPSIHPYFYGTSDLIHYDEAAETLHVWDYKHGAGIVVEVENNPQLMYYACGALEDLGLWMTARTVVLHVAQPRGFHWAGPVRSWSIPTKRLNLWLLDELIPAMDNAMVSRETASGEHCRFCPARSHACPQIMADLAELEKTMKELEGRTADALDNAALARLLNLTAVAKIANKAYEKAAFARLNAGHAIAGFKLAKARSNREWKDGAEPALVKKFGKAAYTKPELKSPAQIEDLPEGESMCARWSFKPDKGLTLVKGEDARPAVNKNVKSLFTDQTKKGRKSA